MSSRKRFYKVAEALEINGMMGVGLDGRPIKTPAGTVLAVPFPPLAQAMAAEWQAQEQIIDLAHMPITQLAGTCLDRVSPRREEVCDHILAYAQTDLVCYRVESPAELAARQKILWDPLLDWAAGTLKACLIPTSGLYHLPQSPEAILALQQSIEALDDYVLTGLQVATAALGSVILGLALIHGRISVEEAFAMSQVEESWQIEMWGEDEESKIRRDNLLAELRSVRHFLDLCREIR